LKTIEERRARQTEYSRRYRARHSARVKAGHRAVYWRRKIRAFEMLGGAFCSNCGCDQVDFLEINHLNGGGSKEWNDRKRSLFDLILSGKRPTHDLNVLCRVCNAIDFLKRKNPDAKGCFEIKWITSGVEKNDPA